MLKEEENIDGTFIRTTGRKEDGSSMVTHTNLSEKEIALTIRLDDDHDSDDLLKMAIDLNEVALKHGFI